MINKVAKTLFAILILTSFVAGCENQNNDTDEAILEELKKMNESEEEERTFDEILEDMDNSYEDLEEIEKAKEDLIGTND